MLPWSYFSFWNIKVLFVSTFHPYPVTLNLFSSLHTHISPTNYLCLFYFSLFWVFLQPTPILGSVLLPEIWWLWCPNSMVIPVLTLPDFSVVYLQILTTPFLKFFFDTLFLFFLWLSSHTQFSYLTLASSVFSTKS